MRWESKLLNKILISGMMWLALASIVWIGCAAKQPYVIHPGSIALGNDGGAFDSHTGDFLSDEKAFLDSFHGKVEPAAVTTALTGAERQYAAAKAAYLAWRTAQTVANLNRLNEAKTDLTSAVGMVASAQSQGGGK